PSLLRSVRGRRRGRPWVVAGFVCLQIILGLLTYWYNSGPCIERQLAASGSFRHETSVTLPGGRKAQVYSTALTPDQACQAIIQMDPERIRYVTMALKDNSDTDADSDKTPDLARSERMLQTDRETVMIYESETGATFVQVSAADARENRYTAYRPRWPSRTYNLYRASRAWYGNAERATVNPANTYNIDTGRYSSIVGSARQASISARRSTGGGSHFGK
ncbi:MAG: hypothetical protein LBR61_09615, partial [Synergistaceae bacterium]|nr:hypothetical protein [Synergistaceae bacterium]